MNSEKDFMELLKAEDCSESVELLFQKFFAIYKIQIRPKTNS
jgi:hypothetical protein